MKTIYLIKRLEYSRIGITLVPNHPYQAVWDSEGSRWVVSLSSQTHVVVLSKFVKESN
jgi:hypothetical protein